MKILARTPRGVPAPVTGNGHQSAISYEVLSLKQLQRAEAEQHWLQLKSAEGDSCVIGRVVGAQGVSNKGGVLARFTCKSTAGITYLGWVTMRGTYFSQL